MSIVFVFISRVIFFIAVHLHKRKMENLQGRMAKLMDNARRIGWRIIKEEIGFICLT